LSYLKAALNPESMSDIKRIINFPARGIGKVTLLKIFAGREGELPTATARKVKEFRDILTRIKEYALREKPSETIKYILSITGIEEGLKHGSSEEEERLENMKELVTLATKYDYLSPEEGIEMLITDAALASDQDSLIKNENGVKLLTVHAAKGLEFDHVFITGLEDGLFPHKKQDDSASDNEEERRLFYVAMTRARKKVYLTFASMRTIFGSKQINIPSEFITDIEEELLEAEEKREGIGRTIYFD
jgi:DNA helicase II / ATP-dependent DNA helicase PcrA